MKQNRIGTEQIKIKNQNIIGVEQIRIDQNRIEKNII